MFPLAGSWTATCRPLAHTPFQGILHSNTRRGTRVSRSNSVESTAERGELSLAELAQLRKQLQAQLNGAVSNQDFNQAQQLKKALEALTARDPVAQTAAALQQAIHEERYRDAARLKQQLSALESELGPAVLLTDLLTTTSDTTTAGVRVEVSSSYLPLQSSPDSNRYFYAYSVRISNTSDAIVQLRHRHWVITDANGKVDEVRGPGVVGEQPVLLPGKSFEYASGCPLTTPKGSMEGSFTMAVWNEADGTFDRTLEVRIGRFMLDADAGPVAV